MALEKAMYWAAVGLMALFVGNNFLVRHDGDVCRLARQAVAGVEHLYGSADRFMAVAEMMLGRSESTLAYSQTTLAHTEARMATMEAAVSRREAACARAEAARARIIVMNHPVMNRPMNCPRQTLRLNLPQSPAIPTI